MLSCSRFQTRQGGPRRLKPDEIHEAVVRLMYRTEIAHKTEAKEPNDDGKAALLIFGTAFLGTIVSSCLILDK